MATFAIFLFLITAMPLPCAVVVGDFVNDWSVVRLNKTRIGEGNILKFYDDPKIGCVYEVKSFPPEVKIRFPNEEDQEANGIFNEPMEEPKCTYDFWHVAEEPADLGLLRYCAKGYFFMGYDYNDTASYMPYRKDRALYISSGRLLCNRSNNLEVNGDLLAKEYTVTIAQMNCGKNELVHSEYNDDDREGHFMLAAVLATPSSLQCQEQDLSIHRLHLKVGHYCTEDEFYEELFFDLSFIRNSISSTNNVLEETNVVIDLCNGILTFETGHHIRKMLDAPTVHIWEPPKAEKPMKMHALSDGNATLAVNGTNGTVVDFGGNSTVSMMAFDGFEQSENSTNNATVEENDLIGAMLENP